MKDILIIDTPREGDKNLAEQLRASGYKVLDVNNAFRAAAALSQAKFDLILCSQELFFAKRSPLQNIILEDARHSKIIILQEEGQHLPPGRMNSRIIGLIQKPIQLQKLLEVISAKVHKVGFSGLLNDIDLTDYLQLLAMNGATKAFVIETEGGSQGVLVFSQGSLIYGSFRELRGAMAFHALMSLRRGRIVDKHLKRIPQRNIHKNLTQLLLEVHISQDETAEIVEDQQQDDFLLTKQIETPPHIPQEIYCVPPPRRLLSTPLLFSLLFCLFLGMGTAWLSLTFPQVRNITLDSITKIQQVLTGTAPLPDKQKTLEKIAKHSTGSIQLSQVVTMAANSRPLKKQEPPKKPAAQVLPLAAEATPAPQKSRPEIILRLHGSNTIGAKLMENLALAYLDQKYQGRDSMVSSGSGTVEKVVTISTDKGLMGIEISAHGSSTGFKDLLSESCDIGMASRRIKEKELVALADLGDLSKPSAEHVLGLDGIAVIIPRNNPLRSISMETIAAIFSGAIRYWEDVPGSKIKGHINVYARDHKSGTFDTFKGLVLKKSPLVAGAKRFESNAELSDDVSRDPRGIGFTGLPYVRQSKALAISDHGTSPIFPNFFTVATEDYPLARRLYLYLPQKLSNDLSRDFVEFCLGQDGQVVVNSSGFIDMGIRQFVAGIAFEEQDVQNRVVFQHYVEETRNKTRLSLNFRFLPNSIELDNRALRDLDRMVDFLKDKPMESVSLIGFADSKGEYQYNTDLALARSKVVWNELKSRGIPITSVISASEEMPVASNLTDSGRQKNRRVEVWIRLNRG